MDKHPERWPVSAMLHLEFAGFRIDVETNSLRLANKLHSYFSDYVADRAQTGSGAAASRQRADAVRRLEDGDLEPAVDAESRAEGELLRRRAARGTS